jgi:hypothetical protein
MITATSEDNMNCKLTRNVSTFKRILKSKVEQQGQSIHDLDDVLPNMELPRRYPNRNRRSLEFYK